MLFRSCPVVIAYFALFFIGTAKGQGEPDCFEHGECMDSLFLDFWHDVEDAQSCLETCQQNTECQYFTYYEEDHSCITLGNCVTFSTDSCFMCYSGHRSCDDLQCWMNGLCNGVLVGETFGVDENGCLEECKANGDCLWFTHDSDGDICLMFQDCSTLDVSCGTCLSGQRQCSQNDGDTTSGYSKIVVIGGENGVELSSVEVIDLANPSSTCSPIPDHPIEISSMAVGLIDGIIKTCGSTHDTDECYDYDPTINTWCASFGMLYARDEPKASFIDNVWLVSGDSDLSSTGDTTEYWTSSGFEEGPTVPVDLFLHCQMTVNSTHVFFVNGRTLTSSYLLDWNSQTWTELDPPSDQDREVPSCGIINNPENGIEAVLVEDGISEIFNFNDLTWRMGPTLDNFDYAGSAQLEDTFVLIGGNDNGDALATMYQFDNINYEFILLDQQLETPRDWYPGAIAVPDDFVSCS